MLHEYPDTRPTRALATTRLDVMQLARPESVQIGAMQIGTQLYTVTRSHISEEQMAFMRTQGLPYANTYHFDVHDQAGSVAYTGFLRQSDKSYSGCGWFEAQNTRLKWRLLPYHAMVSAGESPVYSDPNKSGLTYIFPVLVADLASLNFDTQPIIMDNINSFVYDRWASALHRRQRVHLAAQDLAPNKENVVAYMNEGIQHFLVDSRQILREGTRAQAIRLVAEFRLKYGVTPLDVLAQMRLNIQESSVQWVEE